MPNTITIPKLKADIANLALPEIDMTDNPYDALGDAAGRIAGALEARDERDAQLRLSNAEARLHKTAADVMASGAPDGVAGMNAALAAVDKELSAGFSDEEQRAAYNRIFARVRFGAMDMAARGQAIASSIDRVDTAGKTYDQLASIAYRHPHDIGAVRDELSKLKEHLLPGEQNAFATKEQSVIESYYRGLIARDPKAALEMLSGSKGHAKEGLGIPDTQREALEASAKFALDEETGADTVARQQAQIGFILDAVAALSPEKGAFAPGVYRHALDAHKVARETGRVVEGKIDEARVKAAARAAVHTSVGRSLVAGKGVAWSEDHLEALDDHIDAVVGEGAPVEIANARRTRMAIIAGATPPRLQKHIMASIRSGATAERAAGARMLDTLAAESRNENLVAWAPPDALTFARQFKTLSDIGHTDAAALRRMDAVAAATARQEAARRSHFDAFVRTEDFVSTIGASYGVTVKGVAPEAEN